MLEVFDAFKRYLNILRSWSSAFSTETGYSLAWVYFSYAFDWKSPEDFLAYHDQNFAFIHFAGVRNERKRDFEVAEGLNIELGLRVIEEPEDLLVPWRTVDHLDSYCNVVLEGISELNGVRVFVHKPVVDDVGLKRHWRQAHTAELIFPIADFFGSEFDASIFDIV